MHEFELVVVINQKPKTSIPTISPSDLRTHATNGVYVVFTPLGFKNNLAKKEHVYNCKVFGTW
jgi:hypothetical protein